MDYSVADKTMGRAVGVQPELEVKYTDHKDIFVYFRAGELLNKLLMDPASITLEPCLHFVSKII